MYKFSSFKWYNLSILKKKKFMSFRVFDVFHEKYFIKKVINREISPSKYNFM